MTNFLCPALLAVFVSWLVPVSEAIPAVPRGVLASAAVEARLEASADSPLQVAEAGARPELVGRGDGTTPRAAPSLAGQSGCAPITPACRRRGESALAAGSRDCLPLFFASLPPPR